MRRVHEVKLPTYEIYGYEGLDFDLSTPKSWKVAEAHDPLTALWILHAQHLKHPNNYYRVVDKALKSCEVDAQPRLEAMIEKTVSWLRRHS